MERRFGRQSQFKIALVNGYLEPEHYETVLVPVIRNLAPVWLKLELGVRPSFKAEIDRILDTNPG